MKVHSSKGEFEIINDQGLPLDLEEGDSFPVGATVATDKGFVVLHEGKTTIIIDASEFLLLRPDQGTFVSGGSMAIGSDGFRLFTPHGTIEIWDMYATVVMTDGVVHVIPMFGEGKIVISNNVDEITLNKDSGQVQLLDMDIPILSTDIPTSGELIEFDEEDESLDDIETASGDDIGDEEGGTDFTPVAGDYDENEYSNGDVTNIDFGNVSGGGSGSEIDEPNSPRNSRRSDPDIRDRLEDTRVDDEPEVDDTFASTIGPEVDDTPSVPSKGSKPSKPNDDDDVFEYPEFDDPYLIEDGILYLGEKVKMKDLKDIFKEADGEINTIYLDPDSKDKLTINFSNAKKLAGEDGELHIIQQDNDKVNIEGRTWDDEETESYTVYSRGDISITVSEE